MIKLIVHPYIDVESLQADSANNLNLIDWVELKVKQIEVGQAG